MFAKSSNALQNKAESNIRHQVVTKKVQIEHTTRNSQPCALACMGFMKVTVAKARALKAMLAKTTQYLQGPDVHLVTKLLFSRSLEEQERVLSQQPDGQAQQAHAWHQ
jgi:hypothetical protein